MSTSNGNNNPIGGGNLLINEITDIFGGSSGTTQTKINNSNDFNNMFGGIDLSGGSGMVNLTSTDNNTNKTNTADLMSSLGAVKYILIFKIIFFIF